MTLGGLALAVGILVDEATVEIENIHHKMEGTAVGRAGGPAGEPGHGGPPAAGDALHPRGLPPVVLHAGGGAGAVRAAVAGRRLRDGGVLPALQHVRARCSPPGSSATPSRPATGGRRSAFDRARDAYGRALAGVVRLAMGWSCRPTWPSRRWSIVGVGPRLGPGDLPQGRRRPVPAPDQGPDRDADRGDREGRRRRARRRSAEEVGPRPDRDLGRLRRATSRRATRSTPSTSGPAGPRRSSSAWP